MKYTENYKLKLPEESDIIDVTVLNENFAMLDDIAANFEKRLAELEKKTAVDSWSDIDSLVITTEEFVDADDSEYTGYNWVSGVAYDKLGNEVPVIHTTANAYGQKWGVLSSSNYGCYCRLVNGSILVYICYSEEDDTEEMQVTLGTKCTVI